MCTEERGFKRGCLYGQINGGILSSRSWSKAVDSSKEPDVTSTYCLEATNLVQAGPHELLTRSWTMQDMTWNLCHSVLDPLYRTAMQNLGPRI